MFPRSAEIFSSTLLIHLPRTSEIYRPSIFPFTISVAQECKASWRTRPTPEKPLCGSCAKIEDSAGIKLKRCAKCQTTFYCSRECQKSDWKKHKKVCASQAAAAHSSSTPSPSNRRPPTGSKGLSAAIDKPFHRLDAKTWLHDRPEEDVYKLLIDSYRFRMEDDYNLEGEADIDSIYGGASDGQQGFRRFLQRVQRKPGLLPPWWSAEKAAACMAAGMRSGWSDISAAIEKSDVIEHYGNPMMPMQLRMFGEQVYDRGPGGQSGASMLQIQMMQENGGGGMHFGHIDMSSSFPRR